MKQLRFTFCLLLIPVILGIGYCISSFSTYSNRYEKPQEPADYVEYESDQWLAPTISLGSYTFEKKKRKTPSSSKSRLITSNKRIGLEPSLQKLGLKWGSPVYIQIFKQERFLKLYLFNEELDYFIPFRDYPILALSGTLGPKQKEGDRQGPEGFYATNADLLNPNSHYHLAFNIGYPNPYDRSLGRTGSFIMVHGNKASIGCFAMGDAGIEDIYTLVDAALSSTQNTVPVHAFPFRMTEDNLSKQSGHKWYSFWKNLKEGYDFFESTRIPPEVNYQNGKYIFNNEPTDSLN